ncbi:two-component system regulatory protein YycI [Cohnella sp. 56]|uniref:two-component system regulatory protein YycI n=1 Tax=Cohnella sp. 56 TaxID=3113722 RepID=UPI0030E79784
MDWGRAKTVLILAFLALNMVLGYQLWQEWRERIDSTVDWTSLPVEARQMMQEKNIRIGAKIPTDTPSLRDITYKLQLPASGGSGRIAIEPPPETRIVFNNKELQQALGDVIPELSKYRFDYYGSGREGEYAFNRMIEGLPLFDAKLILYYSEQKIQSYRLDLIETLPTEGGQAQKVLPATQALTSLILKKYLPAGAAVKEVALGYHGQGIFNSDTQVAAPSWRVLLEDGNLFYVNAVSGEVSTDKESTLEPLTGK